MFQRIPHHRLGKVQHQKLGCSPAGKGKRLEFYSLTLKLDFASDTFGKESSCKVMVYPMQKQKQLPAGNQTRIIIFNRNIIKWLIFNIHVCLPNGKQPAQELSIHHWAAMRFLSPAASTLPNRQKWGVMTCLSFQEQCRVFSFQLFFFDKNSHSFLHLQLGRGGKELFGTGVCVPGPETISTPPCWTTIKFCCFKFKSATWVKTKISQISCENRFERSLAPVFHDLFPWNRTAGGRS